MKTILANATKFHPDRCSGIALALLGTCLIYVASPLPIGSLKAPDSGFFPVILATLLILFGLGLLALSFVNEGFPLEFTSRSWGVAICAACLIAYALLIDRVGFLICTSAILILLMRIYGGMKWRFCLMVTLPLVLVAYVGFNELGVPLPHGVLSFIW
jgi:hypothetical protein